MSTSISDAQALKTRLVDLARAAGFDAVRVTGPDAIAHAGPQLDAFLAAGRHGTMSWLADTAGRRRHPRALWPDVRSIAMMSLNYGPDSDPLADLAQTDRANISTYARGDDYHDVIKKKLKSVAREFARQADADVKVFVDTAPVMEKPLAAAAGLGWQGKHTNLVSREFGSWLFLGAVFTDAELPPDEPESDHCGSCRACLDICPTQAFPAPYELDARRCISYLTIEHAGPIPREFRAAIGNRVFGCDDCLAICPWNKFAVAGHEAKLAALPERALPPLSELASLDDAAFRALFRKSPVKRTGRHRFLRNVLMAIGNSADRALLPAARARLADESPLVRGAAVWALSRLLRAEEFRALAASRAAIEPDGEVGREWEMALAELDELRK